MAGYHTHVSTNRRSKHASRWALDPEVTFLNHGSFGACPVAVLEEQSELRRQLEAQPVDFFVRRYYPALDAARHALAAFLDADAEGLAFVNNATTGVNAVLRSRRFNPGDELLVTDHAYGACRNALDFVAERSGAKVVVAKLPFPTTGDDEILETIMSLVTDATRLALIDHVTSATAIVLPIKSIVDALAARNVDTLIDGAHAPGMVPLDIGELGAAYYTGNCHKWICAPKGAAFLWARADLKDAVRPTVISHGANIPTDGRSRFRHEFDWVGTQDPSAWLSVPKALKTMEEMLPGGWPAIMEHNRSLVLQGRELLARRLGFTFPCPETHVGSIATVVIPDGPANTPSPLYEDALQIRLWEGHKIEVPIGPFPCAPQRVLRISAQLYNTIADYERLADALGSEIDR